MRPRLIGATLPTLLALIVNGGCTGGTRMLGQEGDGSPRPQGQPMSPCSVDSECDNTYLSCVPQTVYVCRDPSAAIADAGSGVPTCPATEQITENLCTVRYQLPCQVDHDCGPAGFTCDHSCWNGETTCGICLEEGPSRCSSDDQCPQGWACYTPCPCGDTPATGGLCNPPFAVFHCPVCPSGTSLDGG